jgi:hypothetical protein
MSQSLVNQITIDCLLNKEKMQNHVMKKREKQIKKEEYNFYRKRIYNLFKDIISNKEPEDLSPDVKYAYNTFINATINYFKISDNNDLLQEEYKDINIPVTISNISDLDLSSNLQMNSEADKLLMRSIKMDMPHSTLDKYVTRLSIKKENDIILPKPREVNIMSPEFKNKGLKKNNINNLYEDKEEQNKKDKKS